MEDEVLQLYFEKKMRQVDISKKLDIPQYKITRIIKKDQRYNKEKSNRKLHNQEKHKKETKAYIRKQRQIKIQKNNADDAILRNMHVQASMELSKHRKLSDRSYREWNKSAFLYNEKKKRFEFKKELGRSYDVPKYINADLFK